MRILVNQGTPVPFRNAFPHHIVETAYERNWHSLTNGQLLDAAEAAGFELLVTTDQHLSHQQNLAKRKIRILVLKTASWPVFEKHVGNISRAIDSLGPGQYQEISFLSR